MLLHEGNSRSNRARAQAHRQGPESSAGIVLVVVPPSASSSTATGYNYDKAVKDTSSIAVRNQRVSRRSSRVPTYYVQILVTLIALKKNRTSLAIDGRCKVAKYRRASLA
jgi:hypothetical protein